MPKTLRFTRFIDVEFFNFVVSCDGRPLQDIGCTWYSSTSVLDCSHSGLTQVPCIPNIPDFIGLPPTSVIQLFAWHLGYLA